jgi:pyruvate formate lyase activating enzyme
MSTDHPARWWHMLDDGRIQCDLCPRDCKLHEGQSGLCFVRQRVDAMVLSTYGRSSGFCIDPIEKKPLNHFLPGSSVFSFGTAGCNLACKFCQNWDISKSREMDRLMDQASPAQIAQVAHDTGCASVAFTYNDPVIFAEYAMDTADACHALGVKTVAVTAGYIHAEPRREFFAKMDAANIDLKAFTEDFYFQQTGAHLAPVLETLAYVHHETDCWLELTTAADPRPERQRRRTAGPEPLWPASWGRMCRCTSAPSTRTTSSATLPARPRPRCSAPGASRWTRGCTMSTPAMCTTRRAAPPSAAAAARR